MHLRAALKCSQAIENRTSSSVIRACVGMTDEIRLSLKAQVELAHGSS
jgi:hypothetical protein